jgi:hypothetical protein
MDITDMDTELGTTFSGPVLTFSQFIKELEQFDYQGSLIKLQNFSALLGNQTGVNIHLAFDFHHSPKIIHKVLITRQALSFISKEIILNCKKATLKLDDLELVKLVNEYENLIIDLHEMESPSKDSWLWVLRATNLQHYYLRHPVMVIGRYYYLFQMILEKHEKLGQFLSKKIKLNLLDVFRIGFCIWTVLNLNKSFYKKHLLNGTVTHLKSLLTEGNVNNFLKLFSVTQKEFQKQSKKFTVNDDLLKKYEFNALKRFPIIKTNSRDEKEKYVIPSLGDFMYGFSEGLYYLLIDKINDKQRENLFSSIGNVFENYIGQLLNYYNVDLLTRGKLFSEQVYFRNKKSEVKSADWLLVSEQYIYQIECKKRKGDSYLKAGIDAEDGKKGVNKALEDLAKNLDKLIQKESDIKNNKIEAIKYSNQKIVSIIVYLDEMFAMNTYARAEIIQKMKNKEAEFFILGCHDFEILCQMCRNNNSSLQQNILLFMQGEIKTSQIDFLQEVFNAFYNTLKSQS